jgi:hypothetical protein
MPSDKTSLKYCLTCNSLTLHKLVKTMEYFVWACVTCETISDSEVLDDE